MYDDTPLQAKRAFGEWPQIFAFAFAPVHFIASNDLELHGISEDPFSENGYIEYGKRNARQTKETGTSSFRSLLLTSFGGVNSQDGPFSRPTKYLMLCWAAGSLSWIPET